MIPATPRHIATVPVPLQQRIARLVASLPEAEGFALAGQACSPSTATSTGKHEIWTTSRRRRGRRKVQRLGSALERALADEVIQSQRLWDLPTFIRLVAGREPDRCEVDVAIDYRALRTEPTMLGPTLAPKGLAANKVLAIFDRAKPRDSPTSTR